MATSPCKNNPYVRYRLKEAYTKQHQGDTYNKNRSNLTQDTSFNVP